MYRELDKQPPMTNKRIRDQMGTSHRWAMFLWQLQAAECRMGLCCPVAFRGQGCTRSRHQNPSVPFASAPQPGFPGGSSRCRVPLGCSPAPRQGSATAAGPSPAPLPVTTCILFGFCFRIRALPRFTIDSCWGQFCPKMASPAVQWVQQLAKRFYELRNL